MQQEFISLSRSVSLSNCLALLAQAVQAKGLQQPCLDCEMIPVDNGPSSACASLGAPEGMLLTLPIYLTLPLLQWRTGGYLRPSRGKSGGTFVLLDPRPLAASGETTGLARSASTAILHGALDVGSANPFI